MLFILICNSIAKAQDENNNTVATTNFKIDSNIQSPNSASLGTYGSIPVSLYSGTPNVTVPLYQINEGIPLDIVLQYDASGVRVNSIPGWVGQNWSLQAGGLIQRSVKGRSADEFDVTRGNNDFNSMFPNFNNWGADAVPFRQYFWPWWNQGYKYHASILAGSDWASSQNFNTIWDNSFHSNTRDYQYGDWFTGSYNVPTLKKYQPDLEPDVFTFNFMGHTGKFFLGQDGQWKVASSSNFKVICDFDRDVVIPASTPAMVVLDSYAEFPRVINKITLIDDSGNQFIFGTNEATELSFPDFFSQHSLPIVSSAWYLKYVKDKFGNVIYEFEYQKGPYVGHFYLNYNKFVVLDGTTYTGYVGDLRVSGQLILPVYLKNIRTKSGLSVEMNSSIANAMKYRTDNNSFALIDGEQVWYENERERNWSGRPHDDRFCHDYFSKRLPDFTTLNPEWNASNDRFSVLKWKKLDDISIKDANGNNLLTVGFNYINNSSTRLFLTDIAINTTKKYQFEYNNAGWLPNFLSKATDHLGYFKFVPFTIPLGFDWSGFYNQRLTDPEIVKWGSLKKIIYPTKGFTEFTYEAHKYAKELDKNGNLIPSVSEGTIGGLRIKKLVNNDGLGNNYVKEYQYTQGINSTTSSGNLLFKPIYYADDINTPNALTFFPATAAVFDINQLIPMTNLFGNTVEYETVIEKESYFNSTENISNSGYNIYKYSNYSQFPDLPPINSTFPDYTFKLPKTDKSFERGKLLQKSVYDNLGNVKEKTTYSYESNSDSKINAISIAILDASYYLRGTNNYDSQNEKTMSGYQMYYTDKYVTEVKKESFSAAGTVVTTSKYGYKRYPEVSGTLLTNGDLFKKTEFEQNNTGGILKTYDYPFEDLSNPLFYSMYSSGIIPPVHVKEERVLGDYTNPDEKILISEQKTDYFEIRNIYNGQMVQVPQAILHKNGSGNYKTDLYITKYDYQGNLIEYKNETGIPTSIIWGYNKTKPIAKFENATYEQIASSLGITSVVLESYYNETNLDQINSLRNNAALPNVMVTTYSYVPLFGVSTITDPKGYTLYYSYDTSGRLQYVKDAQGNIISENQYHYKN
ncbi:MAG TPA: hypothetical protein VF677_12065 [Flavobacterium sp.]